MKFTSEDLMKAMGLSVGDRVKVKLGIRLDFFSNSKNYVVEIFKDTTGIIMIKNDKNQSIFLTNLIGYDFEILPRPKRVGDTLCKDYECDKCHLRCLPHCNKFDNGKKTLFNTLNSWNEYDTFDQEIHDLLKARLDKEVE